MTIKTWKGAADADWFTASNWTPAGVPADGDTVQIATAGPELVYGDPQPIGSVDVTLGSTVFQTPASLAVGGYSLPAGFDIDVGDAAPFASLTFGAAYNDDGQLLADTTFDGQINVSNAILTITVPSSSAAPAVLEGNGTTTLGRGALVSVTGTVAASQTVAFADANATLMLTDPADFAADITGFTTGDRIELGHLEVATSVTYDAATETLDIFEQDGSLLGSLHLEETDGPLQFYVAPFGHGGSIITTSDANRTWAGGVQDWYDAASWQNGVPLGGDTASIGSGTASISAHDVATYGALDAETVVLGDAQGAIPVTLESDGATFGEALTIVTTGEPDYDLPIYTAPDAELLADGTTRFEGLIRDQAEGGTLEITIGSGGAFELVGNAPATSNDNGNFATVLVGQESSLLVQGGLIVNDGLVLVDGVAEFAADTTLQGYGTTEIEGGGDVIVTGTVAAVDGDQQIFQFADSLSTLTLSNIAAFQGLVRVAEAGDRIDLPDVTVASLVYEPDTTTGLGGTQYGTLTLIDNDGGTIGQILISDPNSNHVTWNDFSVTSDGSGGSQITYTPQGPVTLLESLPVAAVGVSGQEISFASLLTSAFGEVPPGFTSYTLSGLENLNPDESYWDQGPGQPANSYWLLNGQVVTTDTTISADEIGDVQFVAGNNIIASAHFSVPTATGSDGSVSEYTQYAIWTVDPAVSAANAGDGAPDPSDIVASANLYNEVYDKPHNTNDCNSISDDVTAAAGAVQPFLNFSTDPSQNQEGGFWRIVYSAAATQDPVQDWFSLVQPGDVVRMGRIDQTGEHTTTILGYVNADGSISVYDNGDHTSDGVSVIGEHDATYWTGTDPNTITIYRLDPLHQYLITGTKAGETIQGSVFNNLIHPVGGNDTITAGAGTNEIQGTAADLNGDAITDFHPGDSIDVTDLATAGATVTYQAATGTLTISNGGTTLSLSLPTGLDQAFSLAADSGGDGSLITLACFATGTRLETPGGQVAVEDLRVDDWLRTACDTAVPARRIIWIGQRHIDLARHQDAESLQPVCIAPHTFGLGMPSQPLFLSPDHAIFVDGVLIPVRYLVNGQSIRVVPRASITYWHVELDCHDTILAEGLHVESFLDTGQRGSFSQGGDAPFIPSDFCSLIWDAKGCAPLTVTGPAVEAVRARLQGAWALYQKRAA